MRYKFILKIITTILIMSTGIWIQGCAEKDKQTVLNQNVKEDIVLKESEINDLLTKGTNYLNSSDFEKAKECYEKAISIDITKEQTYLTIKDNYINTNRYDDAYYIIKLALDNNVSRENMNSILNEIQSKFKTTSMSVSVYEGDTYTLPSEASMIINNVSTKVPIRWNNSTVNTSNPGAFTFEGYADEYGRTINLNLNVSEKPVSDSNKKADENIDKKAEPINSSFTGYIKDVHNQSNNNYIVSDEVQFFNNPNEADKEYMKDYDDLPEEGLPDGYYIRNASPDTKVYKLSPDVTINLCEYTSNPQSGSNTLTQVSTDELKNYITSYKYSIFKIQISNDIVSDITMIYLP